MDEEIAAKAFAALAQPTRLTLVRLLAGAGSSGMLAGQVAARLAVPASTLSFHLAALERAGLIHATRSGRQIRYAVRFIGLRALLVFLTETCCADGGGHPGLFADIARLLPVIDEPDEVPMTAAFNVLFLCTRNSARSIMAEAILRQSGAGPVRFNAYSAGSNPAARPMPMVMAKLASLGHDLAPLHSKSWEVFLRPDAPRMDFIIALCDVLDGQACPDFGGHAVTASWPLPDPGNFTGTQVEREALLNELYASLHRRIGIFANLPFATLDRMTLQARLDGLGDVLALIAHPGGR